jgi:ABC-2 type transport system ATP-binding protein
VDAIAIDGLSKTFAAGSGGGRVQALDAVTLRVRAGEIVGLLGPNGSGKSTLLKIVLGLLAPTAGTCRLFGVPADRVEARVGVGYLPEAPEFCPRLTGFELAFYYVRLGGLARRAAAEHARAALDQVGLTDAMHRRVGTYSKGMRQRLGLAQALAGDPRLVILDEPTAGVDPVGAAEMGRLMECLRARGATVLFSSHLLGQAEAICDRVAVLDDGRIVLEGRVDALTRQSGRMALLVDPLPDAVLRDLHGWLQTRGASLHGVETPGRGLNRVFLEAVGSGTGGAPES